MRPNWSETPHDSAILPSSMRYTEMPVKSASFPVGGMPLYSPWWVARHLQQATTLSPSAMRSSIVLCRSGKPRRKSAASCLAASASSGTKSSAAASRLPVWFQSSYCSLRTTALFSTDMFVSSLAIHLAGRYAPRGIWGGTEVTPAGRSRQVRLRYRRGLQCRGISSAPTRGCPYSR
jgi:hypothetical protein